MKTRLENPEEVYHPEFFRYMRELMDLNAPIFFFGSEIPLVSISSCRNLICMAFFILPSCIYYLFAGGPGWLGKGDDWAMFGS